MSKKHIHWKKVELLAKFMNPHGKIMNKYQTRLPTPVQRKVSQAIKHAKTMNLFPYVGMVKPTDKIPLSSDFQENEEFSTHFVNPKTGTIYRKSEVNQKQLSDDD